MLQVDLYLELRHENKITGSKSVTWEQNVAACFQVAPLRSWDIESLMIIKTQEPKRSPLCGGFAIAKGVRLGGGGWIPFFLSSLTNFAYFLYLDHLAQRSHEFLKKTIKGWITQRSELMNTFKKNYIMNKKVNGFSFAEKVGWNPIKKN